jgi:hypothetical protein
MSKYYPIWKIEQQNQRAKYLITGMFWWSRWDSNPRPPRCELDDRQKRKYLPFQKLQPPKNNQGFAVLSHFLPSRTRSVRLFLSTYWPLGISRLRGVFEHLKSASRARLSLCHSFWSQKRENESYGVLRYTSQREQRVPSQL